MATSHHTLDRASFDRLESLYSAYESLQVLSLSSAESSHVGKVLLVLNDAFLQSLDMASPKSYGVRLVE